MKKSLTTALPFLFSLFSLSLFAQGPQADVGAPAVTNASKRSGEIVDFTTRCFENILYFNVKSLNEQQKSYFILERSESQEKYEVVQIKEVVPNSINLPISYSMIDRTPLVGHYRVLQVFADRQEEVGTYYHNVDPLALVARTNQLD